MYKLLFFIVVILSQSAYSQELYPIGIGGTIYGSANANANQPARGRQTGISANYIPSLAFSAYLPYSSKENIGMFVDLGMTNLSYSDRSVDYGTQYQTSLSYLSAAAYLHLNGFLVGVNLGYPVSVKHQAEDYGLPYQDEPIKTINSMAEIRIGYQMPVYTDNNGRLLVSFMAGYQLNGVYSKFVKYDPNANLIPSPALFPPQENQNPRIASVYIGISYLFNIIY